MSKSTISTFELFKLFPDQDAALTDAWGHATTETITFRFAAAA